MSSNNFLLSLFEASSFNKLIPFPYKLEPESDIAINFNKKISESSTNTKKSHPKNNSIIKTKMTNESKTTSSKSNRNSKNKSAKKTSRNNKNIKKNNNSSQNDFQLKVCENFYSYIKQSEFSSQFYTQKKINEPCLINIEKKLKNKKYHFLLELVMDLRNLCNYYLNEDANDDFDENIIYNANKLLQCVEMNYKKVYRGASKEYKKVLNLALEYDDDDDYKNFTKKDVIQLSEKIKKLNPKQLIGLVKLIRAENKDYSDEKYYEFNLINLNLNTLNKIDYYIKSF